MDVPGAIQPSLEVYSLAKRPDTSGPIANSQVTMTSPPAKVRGRASSPRELCRDMARKRVLWQRAEGEPRGVITRNARIGAGLRDAGGGVCVYVRAIVGGGGRGTSTGQ